MTQLATLIGPGEAGIVERDLGSIRLVVLNNPARRNALSVRMRQELARAFAAADADEGVRVIVLTGSGGTFCSGLDVSEPGAGDERIAVRPHPGAAARAVRTPLIAAVDGYCVTGGLELALSCSFVIASTAARFADTHARLGLFPSWGLTALLPRAVGTRRARQLSLTGEFIDAATALAWGIATEVVAPEALLDRALEVAASIAAGDQSSQHDQLDLIRQLDGEPLQAALEAEAAAAERRISARRDQAAR